MTKSRLWNCSFLLLYRIVILWSRSYVVLITFAAFMFFVFLFFSFCCSVDIIIWCCSSFFLYVYIKGFQPEWCSSTILSCLIYTILAWNPWYGHARNCDKADRDGWWSAYVLWHVFYEQVYFTVGYSCKGDPTIILYWMCNMLLRNVQ